MTDEAKGITDDWAEDKGAKYGYAFDGGGKLKRWFGVNGIPAAVLIDPTGAIVWRGHPMELQDATIEKSLAGALKKPIAEWPAASKGAAKALAKRQFAKAIAEAEKIPGAEGQETVDTVKAIVAGRLAAVKAWMDAGDFLAVDEKGGVYAKELAGLPEAAEIDALRAKIAADPASTAVLQGQREVAKLTSGEIKSKQVPKIQEKLRKVLAAHPGTAAARDAERALDRLRSIRD